MFYLDSPEGVTCLTQQMLYRLDIAHFPYHITFSALVRGDPL